MHASNDLFLLKTFHSHMSPVLFTASTRFQMDLRTKANGKKTPQMDGVSLNGQTVHCTKDFGPKVAVMAIVARSLCQTAFDTKELGLIMPWKEEV